MCFRKFESDYDLRFTHSMIQHINNIYNSPFYIDVNKSLITFHMTEAENIEALFHRTHVRYFIETFFLDVKRKKLMADAFRTVFSIFHLINENACENML